MKTISTLVMAALCLFCTATIKAQTQESQINYKPLRIGQKLPEITFPIHNYKSPKVNLADFEARLIIIDFWATWCTACITNFPKIEQLQKEYKDQVQFLKVTYQPDSVVLPFLKKLKTTSIIPEINDDKILHQLFPHEYLPHYVWIDQSGALIATTSAEQITAENIDKVLSSGASALKLKVDLDRSVPLFITNDLIKNNELKHYSIFLKGRYDGLASGYVPYQTNKKITGLSLTNLALLDIYRNIISSIYRERGERYDDNFLIMKVKDPAKILYRDDVHPEDQYTYSCNAPGLYDEKLYLHIIEDLNRYSDYTGTIEKQKVNCYLLKLKNRNTDKLKTKGGKRRNAFSLNQELVNCPIDFLIMDLGTLPSVTVPIIDETGYKNRIDVKLSKNPDLQTLRKELAAYNLELVDAKRKINMFTISDK